MGEQHGVLNRQCRQDANRFLFAHLVFPSVVTGAPSIPCQPYGTRLALPAITTNRRGGCAPSRECYPLQRCPSAVRLTLLVLLLRPGQTARRPAAHRDRPKPFARRAPRP